jgi:hypothetical protein
MCFYKCHFFLLFYDISIVFCLLVCDISIVFFLLVYDISIVFCLLVYDISIVFCLLVYDTYIVFFFLVYDISIAFSSLSTIYLLYFRIVPMVWYFCSSVFYRYGGRETKFTNTFEHIAVVDNISNHSKTNHCSVNPHPIYHHFNIISILPYCRKSGKIYWSMDFKRYNQK